MLKLINSKQKNFLSKLGIILQKRKIQNPKIDSKVKNIIDDVKKNKDNALIKYEKRYSKLKNISRILNIQRIKYSNEIFTLKLLDTSRLIPPSSNIREIKIKADNIKSDRLTFIIAKLESFLTKDEI